MDARRRHPLVPYVALPLVLLAYVLSYAPMFRLTCGRGERALPMGGPLAIYRPVDWMIDRTLLSQPLLAWARVCGVEAEFGSARFVRTHEINRDLPFRQRSGPKAIGIFAPEW